MTDGCVHLLQYITAAGNFISSQLGSSCQGNRYGTQKAGGTARTSCTKSHLPGSLSSSPPGGPSCWTRPLAFSSIGLDVVISWQGLQCADRKYVSPERRLLLVKLDKFYVSSIGWDLALVVTVECLIVNAKVETVLDSIPASSVESEGRQMKQCWIQYFWKSIKKSYLT